jgi:hypothetical protein
LQELFEGADATLEKGEATRSATAEGPMSKEKGCSRAVRDLELERYRLPSDGRKWRVLARARAAVLLLLSTYANGDGTFERELPDRPGVSVNFSPSEKKLTRQFARASLYRRLNELRALHLVDWTRPNHYHRRLYSITPNTPHPFEPEHVRDSQQEHVQDSKVEAEKHVSPTARVQVSDSQITGLSFDKNTSHSYAQHPSLDPSFDPSNSLDKTGEPPSGSPESVPRLKPVAVLNKKIGRDQAAHLWRTAFDARWKKPQVMAFLLARFRVSAMQDLPQEKFEEALQFFSQNPTLASIVGLGADERRR